MKLRLSISYLLAFIFLWLPVVSWAASVTLRWQANSEPDIAGYRLYYGTQSRGYGPPIPVGNVSSYTVDGLTEGQTYYFSLTAVDTSGNESGYSDEISANATSSEPATVDYQLSLSTNSDRTSAVKLGGQTISGDVYIFISPDSYISQVVFSVDGTTHNTERYAPYDLGEPFDTATLSNGIHTISATVIDQGGSAHNFSATCTVYNAETYPTIPTDAMSLPSSGWLGMIPGGDQSHVDKVAFKFPATSGDVTLSYEVWDIDYGDEVQILLNGTPITYVPVTQDNQWGGVKTVLLPDAAISNTQENVLVFNATRNPPNQWYWGVRSVKISTNTEGTTPTIPTDAMSLPSSGWLGMIPGGDQSHVDKVAFKFPATSGDVTLSYEVWDIDYGDEVQILLNGTPITYVPVTQDNQWGGIKTVLLPDAAVSNTQENILVFNATRNPPNKWYWGVRSVSVASGTAPTTPSVPSDAMSLPSNGWLGMIPGGDQSHVEKVSFKFPATSGNVTLRYEVWDIDYNDEVQIVLNGTPIAYVPVTQDNQWGGIKTVLLPDATVSNTQENVLVFNATRNPPNKWYWGVRSVRVY